MMRMNDAKTSSAKMGSAKHSVTKRWGSRLTILGLLCVEALLASAAVAGPPDAQPGLSQAQFPERVYECSTVGAFVLTPQEESDRYTYEGINNRGESVTIRDGMRFRGSFSSTYTFASEATQFVVEEFPNGRITLTTGGGETNIAPTTFDCTTVANGESSSSPAPVNSALGNPAPVSPAPASPAPVRGLW